MLKMLTALGFVAFAHVSLAQTYCTPGPTPLGYAYTGLGRVTVGGTTDNDEQCASQGWFDKSQTGPKFSVPSAQESSVSIDCKACSGVYASFLTVWADWNGNGIFEDDEKFSPPVGVSCPRTTVLPFTPPAFAVSQTRLRIILAEAAPINDPCAMFSFGDSRDYSLVIKPPSEWTMTIAPGLTQPKFQSNVTRYTQTVPQTADCLSFAFDNPLINCTINDKPAANARVAIPQDSRTTSVVVRCPAASGGQNYSVAVFRSSSNENQCDPKKNCNVCQSCCLSWLQDQKDCDGCVQASCGTCNSKNQCNPRAGCNVCSECCQSWITDQKTCDACVKQTC